MLKKDNGRKNKDTHTYAPTLPDGYKIHKQIENNVARSISHLDHHTSPKYPRNFSITDPENPSLRKAQETSCGARTDVWNVINSLPIPR